MLPFRAMAPSSDFAASLVALVERALTFRKKRRLRLKMKQQAKHWLVDWVEAIVWAACVVLLVNQYLFQMYRIPSPSMERTLMVGDMIFVDKLVFGPELLPGVAKLPGFREPERGEIIVFESPSYLSKGPAFTILKQLVYMLTFTMVDIDRDASGEPRVQYLIKRAAAVAGDRLRLREGEVEYRLPGQAAWTAERAHAQALAPRDGGSYALQRATDSAAYPLLRRAARALARDEAGLAADAGDLAALNASAAADRYEFEARRADELRAMYPQESAIARESRRRALGWFIPEGRVFPMGDNRDNSNDARYFGPVAENRVLGRARFIYWPLSRLGAVDREP